MLRRNKSLSIIMALCLCLALLAPVFVAPPAAQAANSITCNPTGGTFNDPDPNQKLGSVKVTISDWDKDYIDDNVPFEIVFSIPSELTENGVSRPSTQQYPGINGDITLSLGVRDNAFSPGDVVFTQNIATNPVYNGAISVTITGFNGNLSKDGVFYLNFNNIDCSHAGGDIICQVVQDRYFGLENMSTKIATISATDKTMAIAEQRKISTSGGVIPKIVVKDIKPDSIDANGTVTLTMESKGFTFETFSTGTPKAVLGTGIVGYQRLKTTAVDNTVGITDGERTLTFTIPPELDIFTDRYGLIALVNLGIKVDEKVARVGQDIEVTVKGSGITEETIVVGQYVDYLINITEDKTTELIAGRADQELGTFFMEEVAPGTLVEDRSILIELPAGVEWQDYDDITGSYMNAKTEMKNKGSVTFADAQFIDARTLKFVVDTTSENFPEGAKILFKKLKVKVSPAFRGDVVLKISGKAGAEGQVKVSTVIPMLTMEGGTPAVKLGLKEQKIADVVITESKADAFVDWAAVYYDNRVNGVVPVYVPVIDPDTGSVVRWDLSETTVTYGGIAYRKYPTSLKFYLDAGFRFAKLPKVEVLEGDVVLELDDVKITTPRSGQNLLIIPIRAGSYKTPAKIKISDIYITADRNAPTGPINLYAAETDSDWVNGEWLSSFGNAFNDTGRFPLDRAAECVVADNVTEPPVENEEVGSGTFVIGSNLYTVNGVTRVMDVAPYIKNDRTYVPYRYLAYVLGVAEEDVVWDQSAQTVTLTLGDTTVVATIGSTTLTVNGEAVVMDVAPEIYEGRTMLPARWLAEALGATVGWDNTSRTVVVEF